MRRSFALGAIISGLLVLTLSAPAGAAWNAGDALTYDVSVELQRHNVPKPKPNVKESTTESTSVGTQRLVVTSVDGRGAARAMAYLDFRGATNAGQYAQVQRTTTATLLPDGQIALAPTSDDQLTRAWQLANQTIVELIAARAGPGASFQSTRTLAGLAAPLTLAQTVNVARSYLGFPVLQVTTAGSADLSSTRQTGKLTLTSTLYYDARDKLLVGESIRSFTIVVNKSGGHIEDTASVNIALRPPGRVSTVHTYTKPVKYGGGPQTIPAGPTAAPATPIPYATSEPSANPIAPQPAPTVTP